MQRAAGLGKDAATVRSIATGTPTSTDLATALAIESVGREKYQQPLLDGPLGKLAAKDTTTQEAIEALFPKNPLPNSEREIGTTVSALAKRNPDAASDLVRAHAESTFNNAARDLQTGANQAGGAKFRTLVAGNAQQRLNLREAVEALPNGAARWDGFNKLLDTLEATGTRQNVGSRTAYNAEINKLEGAGGALRTGLKVAANPAKLAQPLIDKYEQYKLGRNLGELATILTNPKAGPTLRALAQAPSNSGTAQALALNAIQAYSSRRDQPVE